MKRSSARLIRDVLALIREVLWLLSLCQSRSIGDPPAELSPLPAETLLLSLSGSTTGRIPAALSVHLATSVAPRASQPPQDPAHLGTSASLGLPHRHRLVSGTG